MNYALFTGLGVLCALGVVFLWILLCLQFGWCRQRPAAAKVHTPLMVCDHSGISAQLPGEENPPTRLAWEEVDEIRAGLVGVQLHDPDWDRWAEAIVDSTLPREQRITYVLAGLREALRQGHKEGGKK